jgi:hypothetical protein
MIVALAEQAQDRRVLIGVLVLIGAVIFFLGNVIRKR